MSDFIGSSGTLVGAALEAAGMFYQSYLLDTFGQALATSLGALVYLIGALVCVSAFIISGRPKYVIWLLVGPGLFYSVICFRTPTQGAEWMFGNAARDNEQVKDLLSALVESDTENAKVSSLFAYYDNFVSKLIRQIVSKLMSGKDSLDADKKFIVRSQLFSIMATPQMEAKGFFQLFHAGLISECAPYLAYGRQLVDIDTSNKALCGENGEGSEGSIVAKYEQAAIGTHPLTDQARNYVAALFRVDSGLIEQMNITGVESSCIANFVREVRCQNGDPADVAIRLKACQNGDVGGARDYVARVCQRAEQAATAAAQGNPESVVDPSLPNQNVDEALEARIQEFFTKRGGSFTCHEIWNLVYAGLQQEAMRVHFSTGKKLEELGLTRMEDVGQLCSASVTNSNMPENILTQFVAFSGNDDPRDIVRFIAKNLFRSEMRQSYASAVAATVAKNGEIFRFVGEPTEGRVIHDERFASERREWEHRSDAMVAAARLPYIQGVLLYWLAIVFPFFALLLLVPGKHAGFFLWFGLWAWVKSWDIGYAVVYLLDDVLYSTFVYKTVSATGDASSSMNVLAGDPAIAIQALREVDPVFHVANYYKIVSTAIFAIPPIMSYIFISGFNGGVGMITQGVTREMTGGSSGTRGFGTFGGISDMARTAWGAPGYMKMRQQVSDIQNIAIGAAIPSRAPGQFASANGANFRHGRDIPQSETWSHAMGRWYNNPSEMMSDTGTAISGTVGGAVSKVGEWVSDPSQLGKDISRLGRGISGLGELGAYGASAMTGTLRGLAFSEDYQGLKTSAKKPYYLVFKPVSSKTHKPTTPPSMLYTYSLEIRNLRFNIPTRVGEQNGKKPSNK